MRNFARYLGYFLITASLVVFGVLGHQLFYTDYKSAQAHERLEEDLAKRWAEPVERPAVSTVPAQLPGEPAAPAAPAVAPERKKPAVGDSFGIIHIPALGKNYAKVIVEGIRPRDLNKGGAGKYPESAMPGEVGNMVLSGHRTTYGAAFHNVGELREGDEIIIEDRDTWYVYRLTTGDNIPFKHIVRPNGVQVLAPVPNNPGVEPTQAWLTLTTCHPKYSARQRLILHALLADTIPKSEGTPASLQ